MKRLIKELTKPTIYRRFPESQHCQYRDSASGVIKRGEFIMLLFREYQQEAVRETGLKQIYTWIDGNDLIIIKAVRQPILVVIPIEEFCKLYNQGGAP